MPNCPGVPRHMPCCQPRGGGARPPQGTPGGSGPPPPPPVPWSRPLSWTAAQAARDDPRTRPASTTLCAPPPPQSSVRRTGEAAVSAFGGLDATARFTATLQPLARL